MRNILQLIFILCAVPGLIAQSAGGLKGKIKEAGLEEPIASVKVVVLQNGEKMAETATNSDGRYTIKPLTAGRYDIKILYVGYRPLIIEGLIISPGKTTYQNVELKKLCSISESTKIVKYKPPYVHRYGAGNSVSLTMELIKMPEIEVTKIENEDFSLDGIRTFGFYYWRYCYYISNINKYRGYWYTGVPAKYENREEWRATYRDLYGWK